MTYDEQEKWIRNRICEKNYLNMRNGYFPNEIHSNIEPSDENVQLDDGWICDLYWLDGNVWSVDILEKSTKTAFTLYIILKREDPLC